MVGNQYPLIVKYTNTRMTGAKKIDTVNDDEDSVPQEMFIQENRIIVTTAYFEGNYVNHYFGVIVMDKNLNVKKVSNI
jgi:hypothetical protein